MTAITVANKDWSIVAAVDAALTAATIDSAAVFSAVTVTTSPAQAAEAQFQAHPTVILRLLATDERELPEGVRGCRVRLELTVATKVHASGTDEAARLQELLRLVNAARNAVEAAPPAAACAWGARGCYQKRLDWGRPEIDTATHAPWAVARVPLEVGFTLTGGTEH